MKLIKTKLLLKHNHNSAVGIATASHIDSVSGSTGA